MRDTDRERGSSKFGGEGLVQGSKERLGDWVGASRGQGERGWGDVKGKGGRVGRTLYKKFQRGLETCEKVGTEVLEGIQVLIYGPESPNI